MRALLGTSPMHPRNPPPNQNPPRNHPMHRPVQPQNPPELQPPRNPQRLKAAPDHPDPVWANTNSFQLKKQERCNSTLFLAQPGRTNICPLRWLKRISSPAIRSTRKNASLGRKSSWILAKACADSMRSQRRCQGTPAAHLEQRTSRFERSAGK